jgi:hypothetical protein
MRRGVPQPSEIFKDMLRQAADELRLSSEKAGFFKQNVIRGDERAGALAHFFNDHLPGSFSVSKGEAIDFRDHRTGQLDLMIFDRAGSSPVSSQHENRLVPCEALYAVIEAKTMLTQKELTTAYAAAKQIRGLAPFKRPFVGPRSKGTPADSHCRCMYIVFSYESNLGTNDWTTKELRRCEHAAKANHTTLDVVERVVVLDRGMIHPGEARGRHVQKEEEGIFLEFYLHVVNFLNREHARRKPVDWQVYSARTAQGWKPITPTD